MGKKPDGSDIGPVNSTDPETGLTETRTSFGETSSISINKSADSGDGLFELGDVITYTIEIRNNGNTDLNGVILTDELKDLQGVPLTFTTEPTFSSTSGVVGSTFETNQTLKPGEIVTFTSTFTVNQQAIDAGGVSNSANVSAVDQNNEPVVPQNPIEKIIKMDQNPSISVLKEATTIPNTDGLIGEGAIINYTITVENTGNVSLTDVSIEDNLYDDQNVELELTSPSPASWPSVDLDVGESKEFTATYVLTQEDGLRQKIINSAKATGDSPQGTDDVSDVSDDPKATTLAGDDDPTVINIDPDPALKVVKKAQLIEDDDTTTILGDVIQYTISLINEGNTTLTITNIEEDFKDLKDNDLTLSSGPTFINSTKSSEENTLIVGETATYIASYIINQNAIDAGGVSNQVTVTSSSPGNTDDVSDVSDDGLDDDGNTTDDRTITTITQTPSLEVTKTAVVEDNGDEVTGPGDTINYTITVENTGNVTLTGVDIEDELSAMDGGSPTDRNLSQELTFESSSKNSIEKTLKVGEIATYSATYEITQDDFLIDELLNLVTASATDPNGLSTDTKTDQVSTQIDADPSFTVNKEVDVILDNGTGLTTGAGDIIYYRITIENTGNVALSDINLTDILENADGQQSTIATTFDSTSGSTVDGKTLGIGETSIFTAYYTIDQDDVDSGSVKNTVEVVAKDPNGVSLLPVFGFVDTQIGLQPNLEVTKTWDFVDANDKPIAEAGEEIQFTIRVKNTGQY